MKQWFRKAALCLALVLSVITLAACGSSNNKTVESIDPTIKSALEQQAMQYAEQSIYKLPAEDIQKQIDTAFKTKDAITYNGLTNYINSMDRLGSFVSVDSAEASKTEDGYRIEIDSTFQQRALKLTLGINEMTGATTEMTFEPVYSMSELMGDAAGNLVVGMGTVFAVLIFIAWIISLFKYIGVFEKKMKEGKETKNKTAAPAPSPAPAPKAAPAPAPAPAASDDTIQAVIAAAIAAYEADTEGSVSDNNGFVPGPTLNNNLRVRPLRNRSMVSAPAEAAPASSPVVTSVAPAAPLAAPAPKAAPAAAGSQGSIKVEAPMPGKILAVKKNAGETVKSGEAILILEAMKMENEIVAPQDGTIASINVSVGDAVESGATLATLD
ncbi:MAG: OadG family protein [Oribacterium sp.]|nr:OadG family protein [Oribacterium sp.]MBO6309453.1 OadG family protein [Oribacterium sp.]MBP3806144.1 OadG family protein [Oribacterium sp.]MBR1856184.1 OadG family protein [Oribacterium sp.]